MSAKDLAEEFVKIAVTHGLAKDVIDLLKEKGEQLAGKVESLEKQLALSQKRVGELGAENASLQKEVSSRSPEGRELDEDAEKVLRLLFEQRADFPVDYIAGSLAMHPGKAQHCLDVLVDGQYIYISNFGGFNWVMDHSCETTYQIDKKGNAYAVKRFL